jgi:hypothetical protein
VGSRLAEAHLRSQAAPARSAELKMQAVQTAPQQTPKTKRNPKLKAKRPQGQEQLTAGPPKNRSSLRSSGRADVQLMSLEPTRAAPHSNCCCVHKGYLQTLNPKP